MLPGCNIPWLSAPGHTKNCKGRIKLNAERLAEYEDVLFNLFNKMSAFNNKYDECLKPCHETRAISRLVKTENDFGGISLTFVREVKVYKYQWAYGAFELIIDIGSSLGKKDIVNGN